jgi:hypothetical protein
MKKMFLLLILLSGTVYSQDTSRSNRTIYLGFSVGFAPQSIGYTNHFFCWAAKAMYTMDNQYLRLSYNRTIAFDLVSGENEPYDNSKVHRIELVYGCITNLSNTHKLFRHFYFGAMIGVSYNNIGYYAKDYHYYPNSSTTVTRFGVPIGVTGSNSFNSWIHFGWEFKYHILISDQRFVEYNFFMMFSL